MVGLSCDVMKWECVKISFAGCSRLFWLFWLFRLFWLSGACSLADGIEDCENERRVEGAKADRGPFWNSEGHDSNRRKAHVAQVIL